MSQTEEMMGDFLSLYHEMQAESLARLRESRKAFVASEMLYISFRYKGYPEMQSGGIKLSWLLSHQMPGVELDL